MAHTVNMLSTFPCPKRNHFDCFHTAQLAGHHRGSDAAPLTYMDGWTTIAELTTLCVAEHDFTILEAEIERLENVGQRDAFDTGVHDALIAAYGIPA